MARIHEFPLRYLRPEPSVARACADQQIETVADLLAGTWDRNSFDAVAGAPARTAFERRVRRFLDEAPAMVAAPPELLGRDVRMLNPSPRSQAALDHLSIQTVGEFVAVPREDFVAIPGVGERSYETLLERVADSVPPIDPTLLPRQLLKAEVPGPDAGTVADLLRHEGRGAIEARESLREVLAGLMDSGEDHAAVPTMVATLRAQLDPDSYRVVDGTLGIERRVIAATRLPLELGVDCEIVDAAHMNARDLLLARHGELLGDLRREAKTELQIHGGLVTAGRIATTTRLHRVIHSTSDHHLAFRLLAFVFHDLHLHGDALCRVDPVRVAGALSWLRSSTMTWQLPIPIDQLQQRLDDLLAPEDLGLLEHLLTVDLRRSIAIHPVHGGIVRRRRPDLSVTLTQVLSDSRHPMSVDDLMFHVRDRIGAARRSRVLDRLRADGSFVELGPGRWDLRAAHLDELEIVRPLADSVRESILRGGVRRNVHDLAAGDDEAPSETTRFLLVDSLRRDASLRHLGRGEFSPRRPDGSPLVAHLVMQLRRAMGEVPFSRFLQNHPPSRQRLVARLLRENRLFISPGRDRIDLIENYPFNAERIRLLLRLVSSCLDEHGGYTNIRRVRHALDETEFDGAYLTHDLLLDLLRRHGRYEILEGSLLAQPDLDLGRRIRRATRDVLRMAGMPLSADQLIVERPELAEFYACLTEMLDEDPLVQSADGLHYELA